MQQFQTLKRLLLFYALTLFIMLSLYYIALYVEMDRYNKQQSVQVFDNLQFEIKQYVTPTNADVKRLLNKPYLQDISYQITLILPSGQTHIHRHTRPAEPPFSSMAFPTTIFNSKDYYQLTDHSLMGVIKNDSGYQLYVVLRHKSTPINWISYQYWLPLMAAIILFISALIYTLRRRANWEQLLLYADNLSYEAKEAYTPPTFVRKDSTVEFLRLGHSLSRVKYQLHNNYRQVKTLQHRLERLVDYAPLPMLMIGRQGQISFFNQRFEQVFATSFQGDISYTLLDFVIGVDKATQQLLVNLSNLRITRTLLVYGIENKQTYQLHLTPWFGEHEQVRGFTSVLSNVDEFVDQSEHLRMQNQKLDSQVKEFVKLRSIIGHELRTPLNAIIGTLDLIETDKLSNAQKQVLMTLTQSSQSMLTMLNDMLDMAKIEAGRVDIVSEPVDIFKLGEHVSDLMVGSTRRQDLDLLYCFAPHCPRYISTDSSRLSQILLNLLGNAVKFTSSGYVALTVEPMTHKQMADINRKNTVVSAANRPLDNDKYSQYKDLNKNAENPWICFSVKDTGIGIAGSEQHKLFSYFNQANPQINQQFGGTGLGLAISNSFAQLLGGFIDLDSDQDQGSTFNLYLPCRTPLYQPVYHFHPSLKNIHLIAVVKHELCAGYLQRIGNYLSMTISTYTQLNQHNLQQLRDHIHQIDSSFTPILLLDYQFFEECGKLKARSVNPNSTLDLSHLEPLSNLNYLHKVNGSNDNDDGNDDDNNNDDGNDDKISNDDELTVLNTSETSIFDSILKTFSLPKILLSRKPERSIPSTALDDFDSFLNQPVSITLLLSEIIRLSSQAKKPLTLAKINTNNTASDGNHSFFDTTNSESFKTDDSNNIIDINEELSNILVLVVDDNLINQKITCKLLSKLGYASILAEDGRQALELLESQADKIALILMDYRMPIMNGIEATQVIRAQGREVPIIALTANDTLEDREICRAAGMNEFLTKPIQKQKLAAVLKRFIRL